MVNWEDHFKGGTEGGEKVLHLARVVISVFFLGFAAPALDYILSIVGPSMYASPTDLQTFSGPGRYLHEYITHLFGSGKMLLRQKRGGWKLQSEMEQE